VGIVRLALLVAASGRVWQSRWLTAAILLPFTALAVRGVLVGRHELENVDQQVRVRLHFLHTQARDLSITGRATLFSLYNDRTRCRLVGPFEVSVRCRDAEAAMLHLDVAWEEAGPGDTFTVQDAASGQNHLVGHLVAQRTTVRVPLPRADTIVRFVPSHPSLGVRVYGARLQTELTPLGIDEHWQMVGEDQEGSVALGGGFWPRTKGDERHGLTKRCAYLRVNAATPGPHLLQLAFSRLDPNAAMPVVTLEGRPIWSPQLGITVWGQADTVNGATTLLLKVPLAASNVIGIECPGPFASARELGIGGNVNRIAYDLDLDRCTVRPDQ
jgi:hypothetical protein